ncbi:hypothetical protein [Methyloceanibacter sp.]|uniref:hypothetical protein n=1 Tax=Methyloceanibacter sp. TaxID=1965321 RepID=UPI003D6CA30F
MEDAAALVNGLFGLVAIVGGLFCTRLKTAALVGLGVGVVYATLIFVAIQDHLGDPDLNTADLMGRLVGAAIMMSIFAVLGHFVRRGVAALFSRKKAS